VPAFQQWLFVIPVIASALLIAKLVSALPSLPDRVAVHFGFDGQPNGWASKTIFIILVVVLAVGLSVTSIVVNQHTSEPMAFMGLTITSVIAAAALWQAIDFNISGKPLRMSVIFVPVILLLALFSFFLFSGQHPLKP
jgi:Protein of unknown function (DUF1648)